ncbi:hypothetical protein BaRGS_00033039, partial [Batillaria attramentaria]
RARRLFFLLAVVVYASNGITSSCTFEEHQQQQPSGSLTCMFSENIAQSKHDFVVERYNLTQDGEVPVITRHHEGRYRCHVIGSDYPDVEPCTYKPPITSITSSCTFEEHQQQQPSGSLTCMFSENIAQSKHDFVVERYNLTQDGVVPVITRHHEGRYRCHVIGSDYPDVEPCTYKPPITSPPEIQMIENDNGFVRGQGVSSQLAFGFRAHSRDITNCGLGHQSTKDDGTLYRFVTGSTNIDDSEDDVLGQRMTLVIVGANVAGFAVLAAIIITLNVVFLRRGRRVNGSPTEMQGLSLGDLRALHRPPTMYSEGSNFYEEIADGVLPLNLGAQAPDPVCRRIEPETGSDGSLVQATMRSPNTRSEPSTDAIVMSTEGGPSSSGGYIDMGQSVKPAVNHKWASQESLGESSDYVDMNERCKSDDRRRRAASRLYENVPQ